jgi:SAM-dependent methyltransferase
MTDEMLDLARENAKKAGVANAVFVKGEMENMPLPNNEADVIISNCVVNLSPDKDAVLREAFRVLKPGGRLAISDIVSRGTIPAQIQKSLELWAGCIAGALSETDYRSKLAGAGFEGIDIEPFREYTIEDAESGGMGEVVSGLREKGVDGLGIFSAVVRATKPAGTTTRKAETIEVISASAGNSCGPGECC